MPCGPAGTLPSWIHPSPGTPVRAPGEATAIWAVKNCRMLCWKQGCAQDGWPSNADGVGRAVVDAEPVGSAADIEAAAKMRFGSQHAFAGHLVDAELADLDAFPTRRAFLGADDPVDAHAVAVTGGGLFDFALGQMKFVASLWNVVKFRFVFVFFRGGK